MKREFLQLAQTYDRKKHRVAGWYVSEKLDGMRAFWDGGITRGLMPEQVPWANVAKHDRYVVKPKATGLWTRYGQPIQAPDWWLDKLPKFPLDGELYAGRNSFQFVISVTKTLTADDRWKEVKYHIFDRPSLQSVLADGVINNTNFKKTFKNCINFVNERRGNRDNLLGEVLSFSRSYHILCKDIDENGVLIVHQQKVLPYTTAEAHSMLDEITESIVDNGGEGVMIRNPIMPWLPERAHHILKYKPYKDAEGLVSGYYWGEATDLGSKLLGLMGSLEIAWSNKLFKVSGFTDEERVMSHQSLGKDRAKEIGIQNPGKRIDSEIFNIHFPRGSKITFKYRELSNDGIPKEASYLRK